MAPDDLSGKDRQTTEISEGKRKVSAWIKFPGEAPDSGITGTPTLNCTDDSLYYGKFDLTYTFNRLSDTDSSTHCEVPEFRRVKPGVFKWSRIRQCRDGWPGIPTRKILYEVREYGWIPLEKTHSSDYREDDHPYYGPGNCCGDADHSLTYRKCMVNRTVRDSELIYPDISELREKTGQTG